MKLYKNIGKLARISNFIFWKRKSTLEYTNILIFDFHRIGDLVLLTSFLKNMKRFFPNSKITLVCGSWGGDIFKNNNCVDAIIHYSAPWVQKGRLASYAINTFRLIRHLRKKSYHIGIEMRGDLRQIVVMWLSGTKNIVGYSFTGGRNLLTLDVPDDGRLKHLLTHHIQILEALINKKVPLSDFLPEIIFSAEEKEEIASLRKIEKKSVGIHPFGSKELKQWPFNKTKKLIEILQTDHHIVIFFGPEEMKHVEELLPERRDNITLFSESLRKFIIKVATLDYLVAMDSGAAHIASAVNTPVITIFGPTSDSLYKPIGRKVKTVLSNNSDITCRPCFQKKCINSVYKRCLEEVSVQNVLDAIQNLKSQTSIGYCSGIRGSCISAQPHDM